MKLLLCFVIIGILNFVESEQVTYFSVENEVMFAIIKPGLFHLIHGNNVWPSFLNITRDISKHSGLEITIGFGSANDSLMFLTPMVQKKDFCHMLDDAIENPKSAEATFMIPELLGLYGMRCPIKAATKNLNPYRYPVISKLENIGIGSKTFIVSIQDRNNNNALLLNLIVQLDMQYWNRKTLSTESSSIPVTIPSIITLSIVITLPFIN